jgi:hypothetical protein
MMMTLIQLSKEQIVGRRPTKCITVLSKKQRQDLFAYEPYGQFTAVRFSGEKFRKGFAKYEAM